ncbi:MAG: VOC family protein [Enhydrobacter sp.]|nr:VOC family protein [Enhydrobacter sp.]
MMHSSTAVFTVRDIQTSLAYYRDKLGFDIAFEYGQPVSYAGVCAGDVTLHLIAASRTPREPGQGAVAIDVDDVDALHADLVKRGAMVVKAPANQDYGLRDFDVADLDGNVLFFAMAIPTNRGL